MVNKTPFNFVIVMFLVFALIGLYWLDRLGLAAGSAYLWLFIIGFVFLVITFIAHNSGIIFWFEIPIDKSPERSLLMIGLGLLVLGSIAFISKITQTAFFNPFVMAPLAQFSLSVGAETFSALQAATSPYWTFFITVLSAAVIEEIVLGWGFVSMGSLLMGYGMRQLLHLDLGSEGNELWDFFMAITFSIIMFAVLHFFNGTYRLPDGSWNWSLFAFAAGFRGVLNMLIYKFGNFGLMFSIGVHALNNAIFLGATTVITALLTFPGGVILDAMITLFIFFSIVNIKKIFREADLVQKDFLTFD